MWYFGLENWVSLTFQSIRFIIVHRNIALDALRFYKTIKQKLNYNSI